MVGCGQWRAVSIHYMPSSEQVEEKIIVYEKNYEIGKTKTVSIGQEIIRVDPYIKKTMKNITHPFEKIASSLDSLYIEAQYKLTNYKIQSDAQKEYSITKYVIIEGRNYNIIDLSDNHGSSWGILIDDNGAILKSGIYSYYWQMLYYPDTISMTPAKFNVSSRKKKEDVNITKKAPFELIYSGKNDVSLNATYREYTADELARTAFYQNLTYRPDAKNIRFKNFEIQIHDASNEKITYTVLEDGLN
jgi:hypothetical protein